jgi:glycine/D-amino acid oxidase-like deaminating enzyme
MTRRTWLRIAGVSIASGCAHRMQFCDRPTRLARVRVAPERVIRVTCGLRPFRAPGFRVEAERAGDKVLVHNYGHGGAGITLSWGSAALASDALVAACAGVPPRVAVVGCGIVGLSSAIALARRGAAVTIYTRDLPPATTSNLAGGHFSPFSVSAPDRRTPAFEEQLAAATRTSSRVFQSMVGERYGVRWIDNYSVSAHDDHRRPEDDVFPAHVQLGPSEHPFAAPYVYRFLTMLIEPATYLAALLEDAEHLGIRVVVRTLDRAALTTLEEPAIVNCTGLGARELVGDDELEPIRGHLVALAPQPEVDYVVLADDMIYMFPRKDGIILGGSYEHGVSSLEPDPAIVKRILAGHAKLFADAAA